MEISCIEGAQAFALLADEWDSLAGRGMTDTPFQSLAYQRAWWTHLGPGRLFTMAAREAGELVGIACLYLHGGAIHFNGCVEETDYLDLIAPVDKASAVWPAILDMLSAPEFPEWHSLDLCNIPETSPSRQILADEAGKRSWAFESSIHEVCPVISLPGSFDAYLDSLDKKQRHELRRKLRRAEAANVVLSQVTAEDDLAAEVDDFLQLLVLSTSEKGSWLNEGRRAVFHEVAAAALANGTLQLLFLEIEGQKAATLFNFDYRDRIWVYNSGLDPAAFGFLSPGVVLTAQAIEVAIESGRREFDFLRGNEPYKYRFGAQDTTVYRLKINRA
jgi:CelD/BcsL family acetyltransferase involved in cellulose biosynthesis